MLGSAAREGQRPRRYAQFAGECGDDSEPRRRKGVRHNVGLLNERRVMKRQNIGTLSELLPVVQQFKLIADGASRCTRARSVRSDRRV